MAVASAPLGTTDRAVPGVAPNPVPFPARGMSRVRG